MGDPDQRNKLLVVVLDEKDIAVADIEFRRVGNFHGLVAHCAAKDPDRVRRTRIAFHILPDLKCDVGVNVPLRALALPYRMHVGHRSLKNKFGLLNQLLESRWNHGRCRNADKSDAD